MVIKMIRACSLIAIPLLSMLLSSSIDNSFKIGSRKSAPSSPISFNSSTLYGPYSGGESVTFSWSYTNTSTNNYSSVNDYIIIDCPSYSSAPLVSKRVARHALSSGESRSLSYTYKIPETRLSSESGLVFKVGVQYSGSYIALLEKKLKKVIPNNINPLNYRSNKYTIKDRSFYLNENDVEESFLFDEYRDYVECDEYNRMQFSKLSFLYSYPVRLTYEKCYIKFIDKNDVFPFINKDEDGYRVIKADLLDNDGRITIDFPDLYYEPISLQPSDQKKGSKTKYLYVPKGKSKAIKDYEFIIEAHNIGINKTSFSHSLETSISPYYLGNCVDADYCIVGGIKE